MRTPSNSLRRTPLVAVVAVVVAVSVAAIAVAAGTATSSRAGRVKVKCPTRVLTGQRRVTCRAFGHLRGPRGPVGPRGAKGQRGARGEKGDKGATGPAGVSGYEVVSQTFKEVPVPDSESSRGLSEVKTVACPGNKRIIGGGSNLGSNAAQNIQQRQVTVSLSAPNGTGKAWSVQLFNTSPSTATAIDLEVFAICANVS